MQCNRPAHLRWVSLPRQISCQRIQWAGRAADGADSCCCCSSSCCCCCCRLCCFRCHGCRHCWWSWGCTVGGIPATPSGRVCTGFENYLGCELRPGVDTTGCLHWSTVDLFANSKCSYRILPGADDETTFLQRQGILARVAAALQHPSEQLQHD